jgi:Protein of unknown function (DUF3501)
MKRIARSDIVDYQTYEELRPDFRRRVMAEKDRRRVLVGPCFNFLFENELTLRYQVQEMMRAERIVRERDIEQEIATYDGLLGGPGELACTLLVELSDSRDRDHKLHQWLALPEHIYLRLADGSLVRPVVDAGQRSEERISSVQYLKFPVGSGLPAAVGIDLPGMACETVLTAEQQAALAEDLSN